MLSNIPQSKFIRCSIFWVVSVLLSRSAEAYGQVTADAQTASAEQSSHVVSAAFPRPLMNAHDERYPFVHYCSAQVRRIADSIVWGQRADTVEWNPSDTLPAALRDRARRCMARFKLEQVGRLSLPVAARLALVAGDDSLLGPVIDSLIIAQRDKREAGLRTGNTDDQRNSDGSRFFRELLDAAPARVDMARRMLVRNDVLNGREYPQGEGIYQFLESRVALYRRLNAFGRAILDIRLMEEGRDSVQTLITAFRAKQTGTPSALDLIRRAMEDLDILRQTRAIQAFRFGSDSIIANVTHEIKLAETLSQVPRLLIGAPLAGLHAPPANVPFTYFRNGVAGVPIPERPMVTIMVGEGCEATCASAIMRLKSRIGDIPMVMLAEVFGNVRKSNPGSPTENAEALRAHLQDSLGITLSLVIDTVPHYVTSAPDLRFLYGKSRLLLDWSGAENSSTFIVSPKRLSAGAIAVIDKHGRVVWDGALTRGVGNDHFLVYVIKKLAAEE